MLQLPAYSQRQCGFDIIKASLIANDPSWMQKYEAHKASLQSVANRYEHSGAARKTTATQSPIPVIFHFMLTEAQLAQIGGMAGIQQRVDSQIMVLNRDFNRENLDSVLIPAGWKPLYGSSGIRFGLAHTDPWGYGTPGYTLNVIPNVPGGFSGATSAYSSAKHASTGGTDSWDATKYLNIWVTNFSDFSSMLGLTTYKSIIGTSFPLEEMGICINYRVFGKRASATDYYLPTGFGGNSYDKGRTLTHEMGHFFEIWHTWGDDGSQCPWGSSGSDDGLADTPPEGGSKFGSYTYDVPGGTYRDSCHIDTGMHEVQPYGVASLDFMNYTDDIAMQLFTHDQAAVMAHQVSDSGENFTLTQHPELLEWSALTYTPNLPGANSLNISPNPSGGMIYLSFDNTKDKLKDIIIINTLGEEVTTITGVDKGYYAIDLSNISEGIYFVKCNFASGSVTRKILLQ